ncbi:hypothetical protein AAHA92_31316 [Salvia divinorum]|uniref:Uncharacterized protein n=1 Tax=Salvia divinorum TaxID=28513 RepID=A0ABD1FTR8_SALDI
MDFSLSVLYLIACEKKSYGSFESERYRDGVIAADELGANRLANLDVDDDLVGHVGAMDVEVPGHCARSLVELTGHNRQIHLEEEC